MERTTENKSTVERQVGRFQAMNYGCNDDRHTELSDAFLGFDDPEDVSRAVTHFVREVDECPTVAMVLNYKRSLETDARNAGLQQANPDCLDCYGSGFQQVPEEAKPGYPPPVRRCHCMTKAVTA